MKDAKASTGGESWLRGGDSFEGAPSVVPLGFASPGAIAHCVTPADYAE